MQSREEDKEGCRFGKINFFGLSGQLLAVSDKLSAFSLRQRMELAVSDQLSAFSCLLSAV